MKLWIGYRLAGVAFLALLVATPAVAQDQTLIGLWLHPNQRIKVEIYACGERLCGKLAWFKWPNDLRGLPIVDIKNPSPSLRTRPLLGLTTLSGLRQTGERTWDGGQLYNPDDGASYQATIEIEDNGTAQMRAYVMFPMLGKTLVWTRAD